NYTMVIVMGFLLIFSGLFIFINNQLDQTILSFLSIILKQPVDIQWYSLLKFIAIELFYSGILLLLFSFIVKKIFSNGRSFKDNQIHIFIIGLILIIFIWLPVIIFGRNCFIEGIRYWWLHDDAMISMRYALNFSSGYGLVWNQGEIVEGYTNFLWTIYMSLIHFIGIPKSTTSLFIIITNVFLAIFTIPYIIKLVDLIGGGILAAISAVICYTLNGDALIWATNGHEMTLISFLVVFSACRVIEESKNNKVNILTYFIIAIISIIRADAAILSGLLYVLSFILNKNKSQVFKLTIISLIIPLCHLTFRFLYYGELLPNTAYLKVSNWDDRVSIGLSYTINFLKSYFLIFIIIFTGSIHYFDKIKIYLLSGIVIYGLYITYVGGDAFDHFRFFIPILPFMIILAFLFIEQFKVSYYSKLLIIMICIISTPIIFPGYIFNYIYHIDYNRTNRKNLDIAIFLKNNVASDSKVADFFGGLVFYFSGVKGIDLLGKSDKHIARLKAVKGRKIPGHTKVDFDYSVGKLKPDFIVTDLKLPFGNSDNLSFRSDTGSYKGNLYYNKGFRTHCLPYPINNKTWRSIVVCDWSNQFSYWQTRLDK
ncbi:MAG: hypothetical protein AB1782_13370, partial [Cyanobacteriota bacterium]